MKLTDDRGAQDALNFLMTREIAHQKMFESALAAITNNFPPGKLPGDQRLAHLYVDESPDGSRGEGEGFELVRSQKLWEFQFGEATPQGEEPPLPDPKPSTASTVVPNRT
jgi:Mn-containing catalase